MGRQLRIVHHTGFRYDEVIGASHNEARMSPRSTPDQSVLATRLDSAPVAWMFSFRDYWGTSVTAFEVTEPHQKLDVVATSLVEVSERPVAGLGVEWDALREPNFVDQYGELLMVSDHVDPGAELRALAAALAKEAERPADSVAAILDLVRGRVTYVPGATEVKTKAADVWQRRAGVCQDLTHLGVGALRSVGIPARYVSGYVMPTSTPVVGEAQTGESHAWLQYWDGCWVGADPTNGGAPGALHVEVGYGRDYFDVPPLRGIYAGTTGSELFVEVEMTALS